MAHKLASTLRKFDRILKNGLFTRNFNMLAKHLPAQPKCLEARRCTSKSSGYEPNKLKGFIDPKENNKSATNVGVKEAADENINMNGNNGSSAPSPSSEPKAPNHEDSQSPSWLSADMDDGGYDKLSKSAGYGWDWDYEVVRPEFIIAIAGFIGGCWVYLQKKYKDFNWEGFVGK